MRDHRLRCLCSKLICVIEGNDVRIKCNRCKRIVVVHTRGVTSISFQEEALGDSANTGAEQ